MRIDDLTHETIDQSALLEDPAARQADGPDLWQFYYLSAWLNLTLLACMIYYVREGFPSMLFPAGCLTVFFAINAGLSCHLRHVIHDFWVSFSQPDQALLGIALATSFIMPAFLPRPTVLLDGWLWLAAVFLPITIRSRMTHFGPMILLGSAWFYALHINGWPELGLVSAWLVSWSLVLITTYWALEADLFDLGGWWAVHRILLNLIVVLPPALIGGASMYWLIPGEKDAAARLGMISKYLFPSGNINRHPG
jgi:hypothetical protein